MERYIKNIRIKRHNNIFEYNYEMDKETEKYMHMDNKLKIEYDINISKVPDEIAVIPFITGILPMIYLENIKIYVDCIDKDFLKAFKQIREGYKKMLPKANTIRGAPIKRGASWACCKAVLWAFVGARKDKNINRNE